MRRQLPSRLRQDPRGVASLAWDAVALTIAYRLALEIRFHGSVPARYDQLFASTVAIMIVTAIAVRIVFGVRADRSAMVSAGVLATIGSVGATILLVAGVVALTEPVTLESVGGPIALQMPVSVAAIQAIIAVVLISGTKGFMSRLAAERRAGENGSSTRRAPAASR